MGLDQGISKKIYVGAIWEHRKVEGTVNLTINGIEIPINLNRLEYVEEKVADFRKFNALHRWVVDNLFYGEEDNCVPISLNPGIEDLFSITNQLLENQDEDHAKELLPTGSGFFFGSLEYDEYYWEDVAMLRDALKDILLHDPELQHEYYYYAWY